MPKSHKRRSANKTQRGGSASSTPSIVSVDNSPSGWSQVMNTVGDGWTQMMNSLTLNPAQSPVAAASTSLVPISNPNANVPNLYKNGQMGGRKGRKGRGRKGGILGAGAVLEQAIVPFALLGLQHTYGKKHSHSKKTRRHRR
jgi:hypothetical protein